MRTLPLLTIALLPACLIRPVTVDHDELVFEEKVHDVRIDSGSGEVEVVRAEVAMVEVERTLRYTGDPPKLTARVDGGVLHLEVTCRPLQQRCSVDHVVRLPSDAHVSVDVGSGGVLVRDLAGDVEVDTGSGDVSVVDVTGAVFVSTGSGNVNGRGLWADEVVVDTGSGDVRLELLAVPDRVSVDTGSGNVLVELPSGPYSVHTDTGSGDVRVDGITSDRSAPSHIDVDTGSGDVDLVGQ
mgnify:CR=1 FL=1